MEISKGHKGPNEENYFKKKCDNGMYITECTLELQGLSSRELAELAGGQSELVTLKLQSNRSLRLRDSILTACYVGQLGNLHHISTFNGKDRHFIKDSIKKSQLKCLTF